MSEKKILTEALEKVNLTAANLTEIAKEAVDEYAADLDKLVRQVSNVKDLTDDQIRNVILLLSVKSYSFAEAKEFMSMKLESAISIKKVKYATVFGETDGTVGAKDNAAVTATVEETLVTSIYSLATNLLKGKLDEAHRLTDSLKTVLMSRMQEAKLIAADKATRAAYE